MSDAPQATEPSGHGPPRRIGKKRKLLYALVCVFLVLLICEVAVRIRARLR